jgi:hypothetical protein
MHAFITLEAMRGDALTRFVRPAYGTVSRMYT